MGHAAPLYLYNIPVFTNAIAAETAVELLSSGRFAGIKDSSGNWEYFEGLLRQAREHVFTLLVGHDSIFTRARMAGADGIVSGVACAVPELLLALDRAIQEQAAAEIERLDGRLQEFVQRIERFPTPLGIKAALAERGIKTGHLATPLGRETRAALDEFREWFRGWLKSL
jgi:4-hydroxy-tetrahydrodipicolinate synthase